MRRSRIRIKYIALILLLWAPCWVGIHYLLKALTQLQLAHQVQLLETKLNASQEQLYDTIWDAAVDTADDALHFRDGRFSRGKRQLVDTLAGYVYPDGHCYWEGIASIDLSGKIVDAVLGDIDGEGKPLPRPEFLKIVRQKPWLLSPWLPDYSFVIKQLRGGQELYVSPFIKAPHRSLLVIAAPLTRDGRLQGAVLAQASAQQIYEDTLKGSYPHEAIFIADEQGNLGYSTIPEADELIQELKTSGSWQRIMQSPPSNNFGSGGVLEWGGRRIFYRTADRLFLGYVMDEAKALKTIAKESRTVVYALYALMAFSSLATLFLGLRLISKEMRLVELETLRRSTGTMTHYLRNSLTAMKGYLELLRHQYSETNLGKLQQSYDQLVARVEALEQLSQNAKPDGQAGTHSMYSLEEENGKNPVG